MADNKPNNKILDGIKSFLTWFLVFYVILSVVQYFMGPEKKEQKPTTVEQNITIKPTSQSFAVGNLVTYKIKNDTMSVVRFTSPCETGGATLGVYRSVNGKRVELSDFSNCGVRDIPSLSIAPGASQVLAMRDFNLDFFNEEGDYFIEMTFDVQGEPKVIESASVELSNPGFFRQLFRALISKPLFNLLVFFTGILPGKSLGGAIVIVTLLVRLALFYPNQKSMRSQREMQKIQPQLDDLRKKYKKDQQTLATKTMELYKTHKVNPMSSCLPMMIQLPVMLGVYHIVRDGLSPHLHYLLYSFQQQVNLLDVNEVFFSLELGRIPFTGITLGNFSGYWNYILLVLLVAGMQWFALRLTLAKAKKKADAKKAEKSKKDSDAPDMMSQMQNMTGMMQWIMPVMIGFFTATFPAAVGIYWLTSTVFGIGQQLFVNRQMDAMPEVRKKIS